MEKIIVIAGATASGKTSTAVKIAKHINGEIISSDSMQIYKKMDIGTAKVTTFEMSNIPHHMIDIIEPFSEFSVAEFSGLTKKIISEIISRGKTPILVGGTGLYIDSIIYPFGFGNVLKNEQIRADLLKELEEFGAEHLHKQLALIDANDALKIHANNTKRLIRALEIYKISGKTKSESAVKKDLIYDVDFNVLKVERAELYEKINLRVKQMIEGGLILEVENLIKSGLNFNNQSMQAIGYKEFFDYFNGNLSINELIELIAKNSRHYAKRQLTWFKKYDFAEWLTPDECVNKYTKQLN